MKFKLNFSLDVKLAHSKFINSDGEAEKEDEALNENVRFPKQSLVEETIEDGCAFMAMKVIEYNFEMLNR